MANKRSRVYDANGVEIPGLSHTTWSRKKGDPKHIRYYPVGTSIRWKCDKDEAIRKFRMWQMRQTREMVSVGDLVEHLAAEIQHIKGVDAATAMKQAREWQEYYDDPDTLHKPTVPEVDASLFWQTVRDAIVADPKEAAKRTGIPELAYLERLDKPKPSLRFNQALDLYPNRPTKSVTDGERAKLVSYWQEFTRSVGVTQIEDVTESAVEAWTSLVFKPYLEGSGSPKSVIHKVTRIRSILRRASEKGHKDCTRVLGMVSAIDLPSARKVAPKPISRTDFHALLGAADTRWRAMLLLALNACYYAVDIRRVEKDAINQETGEILFPRTKTNVVRVAVLWQRTRDALAMVPEHSDPSVFISAVGTPYKQNGFRSAYDRLCAKAGVAPTFSQIRDGAYTAAIRGGADITTVRMIAGHATGMSDAYVMRGGEMVKGACRAIEARYF